MTLWGRPSASTPRPASLEPTVEPLGAPTAGAADERKDEPDGRAPALTLVILVEEAAREAVRRPAKFGLGTLRAWELLLLTCPT
ncbi:MAG TPA: hypothetical protein VLY23_18325 [Candidatus Acidoferrum sp.]|nr:hypothetical protein [Candidatus Acidoferrum sp.]